MHIKRFLEWIGLKEKLHFKDKEPPYVHEGEIWWVGLGENIGFEINGKSEVFTRPVIIFKKFSNTLFFVIPVTTHLRTGTWYVNYKQNGREITACLHHARSIDFRRLFTKIGQLDDLDFCNIQKSFSKLYLQKNFPR